MRSIICITARSTSGAKSKRLRGRSRASRRERGVTMPETTTGQPVAELPIKFTWHTNVWLKLFDKQVETIKNDIARARIDDRNVVYLSCPISSRGGGHFATNVDIARHTERRLLTSWGERFWILNPAQYQMESKEGTGLLAQHALSLGMTLQQLLELQANDPPLGGDYMRMWTRVLAEDSDLPASAKNSGRNFDAFYFLGPTDVHDFFTRNGEVNLTDGLEAYFSRKHATDPIFRSTFSVANTAWPNPKPSADEQKARAAWDQQRKDFVRFYGLRASVTFSKGSHDEWNILLQLNERRLKASNGDVGILIAAFFDGKQVSPGSLVNPISTGYAS